MLYSKMRKQRSHFTLLKAPNDKGDCGGDFCSFCGADSSLFPDAADPTPTIPIAMMTSATSDSVWFLMGSLK